MSDVREARDEEVQRYYEKQMATYDAVWGVGNIHMGVFVDVSKIPDTKEEAHEEFVRGAERITSLMAQKGGLDQEILQGAADMLRTDGKLVLCDLVGSDMPPSMECEQQDYAASANCCREGEVGMILVVAHKIR
eukprot:jgi/Pico_ML_1/55398/g1088.t1